MKIIILSVMLNVYWAASDAAVYKDTSIKNQVLSSELIVKGTVTKKSSKTENVIIEVGVKNNGEITFHKINSKIPVTTYVILIDELINGEYKHKNIAVKMEGGCGDDGICLEDSTNYHYQVNDKVVIFLNYNVDNKNYYSNDGSLTAFKLTETGNLYRQGEFTFINEKTSDLRKELDETVITLRELKNIINNIRLKD